MNYRKQSLNNSPMKTTNDTFYTRDSLSSFGNKTFDRRFKISSRGGKKHCNEIPKAK